MPQRHGMAASYPMSLGIETHLTGRLAAAVWAATALAGAVATVGPLEIPGSDVSQMREIAGAAGFFAGVSFVVPWERLPKFAFHVLLVLMSAHIAALAYASGAAHSELTIIFTFVVALAACFLPVKASVAQLCLIAIMLTVLLLVVGRTEDNRLEVIRVTMLLATLVVLCGLVLVMRALLAEDELGMRLRGAHRYGAGLLSEPHLMAAISAELSRAARHARPLALVMIDVTGTVADQAEPDQVQQLETNVSRAILGRIRVEDSAAHLGGLRFAVMAPETTATGAAAVAGTVSETVRKRLITAGYEGGSFDVAVGWADYPHNATSPEELMAASIASLEQETGRAAFGDASGPHPSPSPAPGT